MNSRQWKRLKKASQRAFWLMAVVLLLCVALGTGWWVIGTCLALVLLAVAIYLQSLRLGQAQAERELKDLMARDSIQAGNAPPIVLFLRSFDVAQDSLSGRLAFALLTLVNLLSAATGSTPDAFTRFDAEEELDDALGSHGVFVAIGDKQASYGSAKLTVDDTEWKQTFQMLAQAARLIFMMPGPSASVHWELAQILGSPELTGKTAFIMRRQDVKWTGFKEWFSLQKPADDDARNWAEFAAMARRDFGLAVPLYNSEGCCFRLRPQDRSCEIADLEAFTRGFAAHLASQTPGRDAFDIKRMFDRAR